jgi:hypothetical protein
MYKIIFSFSVVIFLSACGLDSNDAMSNTGSPKIEKMANHTPINTLSETIAINVNTETASAEQAVAKFSGELKTKLADAIKSSGPMKALAVCNHQAPAITAHLADVYAKQLSRVSLKYRNRNNAPDDWQRKILEDFEARHAMGEEVTKMVYAEIVENKGKRQFRFMQAIAMENTCLVCHGSNISPKLQKRISELYPKDQAVDYEYGDIRGAFVVVNNLAKNIDKE